jgi:hypothetical protein
MLRVKIMILELLGHCAPSRRLTASIPAAAPVRAASENGINEPVCTDPFDLTFFLA